MMRVLTLLVGIGPGSICTTVLLLVWEFPGNSNLRCSSSCSWQETIIADGGINILEILKPLLLEETQDARSMALYGTDEAQVVKLRPPGWRVCKTWPMRVQSLPWRRVQADRYFQASLGSMKQTNCSRRNWRSCCYKCSWYCFPNDWWYSFWYKLDRCC